MTLAGSVLNFVDISAVVVSGTISIADTAQYNGQIPCPIIDARVCAFNHFGVKEELVCTTTDAYGLLLSIDFG
jgi:hypothetical protein